MGRLRRVQRFSERNGWEDTGLDNNLLLQWANEAGLRSIEQHPGVERMLNVFYVQDTPLAIVPCVNPDADIPSAKLADIFPVGAAMRLRFHIQIDCSDRANGRTLSIAPEFCVLEAHLGDDPLRSTLTLL